MSTQRDPSLHIRKSHLEEVLNLIPYDRKMVGKVLVEKIFEAAQKYQITDRYIDVSKAKSRTRAKIQKSIEADKGVPEKLVEKFNALLTAHRQIDNHNAKIRVIRKDSKDYLLLKEVAKMAHEFSEHFDIQPIEDGYKEYIEIGIGFMGRYALNRFKTYHNRIFEEFENRVAVVTDDKPNKTRQFFIIWKDCMEEYAGLVPELSEADFSKYSHIVYGRVDADKKHAHYEDWIRAQFEGLSFLDAIPELVQFYGENARRRYDKYMNSVEFVEEEDDKLGEIYKKQIESDE